MNGLLEYAKAIVEKAGKSFVSGEVFAKVLTNNDDSGRHGVLIPTDGYSFFPDFPIPDPTINVTMQFSAFDAISASSGTVAYKYYERYPERRITRLHSVLNDLTSSLRLLVFLHAKHSDGSAAYYVDCANSTPGGRLGSLFNLVFGDELEPIPGNFIVRPIDCAAFSADATLTDLLGKFDEVKGRGWIDTMRDGDTGIGYTFETLVGIKENNDQKADFKGIEIKCKGVKEGDIAASGKINIFQAGPTWLVKSTGKERIRILGKRGNDGLYACHSQVTTTANNLGLLLQVLSANSTIDLRKNEDAIAYWSFARLEGRLAEKHSRAAFVKARARRNRKKTQYSYEELVYCEKPSIQRFVDLVSRRNIVFEFIMSEEPDGRVRNHGYPWRLTREEFLEHLFALQIKLR